MLRDWVYAQWIGDAHLLLECVCVFGGLVYVLLFRSFCTLSASVHVFSCSIHKTGVLIVTVNICICSPELTWYSWPTTLHRDSPSMYICTLSNQIS